MAWGELAAESAGTKHLSALLAARRPVPGRPQLTHGDLTGNVLFAGGLPPLIIDLSLYRRPPAFASAIVIADALLFEAWPDGRAGGRCGGPVPACGRARDPDG